jgi:hypothetical protein
MDALTGIHCSLMLLVMFYMSYSNVLKAKHAAIK